MNIKQLAIIKKDIRSITANKQLTSVMLIVPLVLTLILPTIFVIITVFMPDTDPDLQKLLDMLPISIDIENQKLAILGLFINKIMPIFFLMIPIMASSVMAASSFVGEKEKHTLETLLYSPLSLKQLFQSKILASFSVGMMVSLISFAAMAIVLEIEALIFTKSLIVLELSWVIVLLLVAPSVSLVAISIMVRGSAKAQTVEEAQQRTAFMVFPIILLIIGQFTGVIMISSWLLLGVGAVLALIAALIMRGSVSKFNYEKLLM